MARTVSMLLALLGLVAVAAPQFASANARVTDPAGTLLSAAPEAPLVLTNVGSVTLQSSLGAITCPTMALTTRLTANTGTTYRALGFGTGTSSGCTFAGKPITITNIKVFDIHSSASLHGTIEWQFVADLPGGIVCNYSAIMMSYTVSGTDTIRISSGDFTGSPLACEPGTLNAEFTIETDFSPFTQIHLD